MERNFADVPLISAPRKVSEGTLQKFRMRIQEKYNVKIENYWDLHKWSVENISEFWEEIWNISGIIYSKTFDQVLDTKVRISDRPEWFRGARLNFAENLLRFRDDHPAVVLAGEERQPETITYAQLYQEASLYAAAFRKCGLKKGDRVACYMSSRKEPILVMIGVTCIGAIFAGTLPMLGAQAVLDRLKQIEPKILFTIDRFLSDGKEFEMLKKVEKIAEADKHHLRYLVAIVTSSSAVKLQNHDFVCKKVKKDIFFQNIYASSEAFGSVLTTDKTLPMYKGEIPAPSFATVVQCYNDAGASVTGELGELVITIPSPLLLLGLWNDEDGTVFRKTYCSKYTDVFAPGDLCIINPVTKGFIMCGRSDETLKYKGITLGCSDIYNVVNLFEEILDSVCVSQYRREMEERVVLFVKTRSNRDFNDQLVKRIKDTIEKELTRYHVPSLVLRVNDIPRNMNGKKMEMIVKKIINDMPYNADTVINKECLKSYCNIPELANYS